MMLHRGDLHGILADAVRGLKENAIKLGKRCVAVPQSDEQVEVRFESGEPVKAAFVIGADGIHSEPKACPGLIDVEAFRKTDTLVRDFDVKPSASRMGGYADCTRAVGVGVLDCVSYEFMYQKA